MSNGMDRPDMSGAPRDWRTGAWRHAPGSLFALDGRVVVVTGAASGLGRAAVLGLDAHGARVVLADRDAPGAEQVAATLAQPSIVVTTDVTRPGSMEQVVKAALDAFGRLDAGVLMPGINVRKPALDLTDGEWDSVIDLNLSAMFRGARALGRALLERGGGSMVLMASARALTGGVTQTAYSASKAGIVGMMRCLALEWAPTVRVNALAPGYMATPLVHALLADPECGLALRELHALGRIGDPEEIAGPIVFLLSDASSFVTGAVLPVDGGWTAGRV